MLADCPRCRVEGAVLELIEPGEREGLVLEAVCRLCGRRVEAGGVVDPGRELRERDDVLRALEEWARSEGERDVEMFVRSNFSGMSPVEVAGELLAGRPVATCFDAVAWLFPGTVGGSARSAEGPAGDQAAAGARPSEGGRRRDDAGRVAARALIAVMVGDGKIRPEEREFIDRCLREFGYPPVSEFDIRPWRPGELGRPEHPEALVEAMARLVYVDRERDGSEWRIVREFARSWGYPMDRLDLIEGELEQEYAPRVRRFWMSVRRLFIKDTEW